MSLRKDLLGSHGPNPHSGQTALKFKTTSKVGQAVSLAFKFQ